MRLGEHTTVTVPDGDDCGIRRYAALTAELVREGGRMVAHVDFCLYDTMQASVGQLADSVPLGAWPEGIYDLDTGEKTEVQVPVRDVRRLPWIDPGTNPLRPLGDPQSASAATAGAH